MKKIIAISCFFLFVWTTLCGQTPFTYQAMMRDSADNFVCGKPVGVRVTLLVNASPVYQEKHTAVTTSAGLLEILVGNGTKVSGDFASIDWSNSVYMKLEFDMNGGESYALSSIQQMQTVPVVTYADNAGTVLSMDYSNVQNKPVLFNGDYNMLTNKPTLFDGDYNSLTNKPILFDGDYNSLTNKPTLFDGDYNSLTNKPTLFDGDYNSLSGKPNIYDTVSRILKDSAYLRSYSETQTLGLIGNKLFITNGDTVVLSAVAGKVDYNSLTNLPDIADSIRKVLADSNFLSGVIESQMLSIEGDTLYLTNGGSIVLPIQRVVLNNYLLWGDTNQTVAGTKTFADTILVPKRFDVDTWALIGDSAQILTYGDMLVIADSLVSLIDSASIDVNTPLVITNNIISNTFPMVNAGGKVTSQGKSDVTARGICYSLSHNPTLDDSVTVDGSSVGTFTSSLGPVLADTVYYARAYATNSFGTTYGNEVSFTTPTIPSVELYSFYNVQYESVTVEGNVSTDGGNALTAVGACWCEYPNIPTIDSSSVKNGKDFWIYSTPNTLKDNTTYCLRLYATNSVGTGYSETVTFTTLEAQLPTPYDYGMGTILGNMASCYGEIGNPSNLNITDFGVCWSETNANPTLADSSSSSLVGNSYYGFTGRLTNLKPNTTYYYTIYAVCKKGTVYSTPNTFTTTSQEDGKGCPGQTIMYDYDGNSYATVQIGNQCWMKENLRCTTYNGSSITLSTSSTSSSTKYRYYPNGYTSSDSIKKYGYLYNWSAATGGSTGSNVQGICPSGWHLPSSSDFSTLLSHINTFYAMTDTLWNYIYRMEITDWCVCCYTKPTGECYTEEDCHYNTDPMTGEYIYTDGIGEYARVYGGIQTYNAKPLAASGVWTYYDYFQKYYVGNEKEIKNNASGFSAMPAGCCDSSGSYSSIKSTAYYWTSSSGYSSSYGYSYNISSSSTSCSTSNYSNRYYGYSVRCIKNN